jgi:hypothetical protein
LVETDTVPKMRIANGIFLPVEGEAREPLGQRIIETPENVEATEVLRDDRYGFIAYVPVGSINKGAALVMAGGGGKTTQCTICHGADLTGLGLGLRLARPLSQLSRAPALSHAARHAFRGGEGPDDTGGYQIDDRRHVGDSRLTSFAERPVGVCNRRAKLAGFAAQHPSNALLFDGRLCGLRRSVPRQNPF